MRKELLDLRTAMARAGIDAYVIPTDDFHGSEYVGDYFKCRSYVSGFTGSAGTLVVTAERAGLWTDGRYFLQAEAQLVDSGIDLMKQREPNVPTVSQWLEAQLQPGQVLGFDGRSMVASTGEALENAVRNAGASLRYDLDLVGEIWSDRPAMSEEPVWALSLEYAGQPRAEKLAQLKQALKDAGADTHILTSLDDIAWLLNIRGNDVTCCPVVLSYLLVTHDAVRLYVNGSKFTPELRAALEADGVEFRPYLQLYSDVSVLPADACILADPQKLNYTIMRSIPRTSRILSADNPTTIAKSIKNPTEVKNERLAHLRDGIALTKFMKWLKDHVGREQITELSACEVLENFRAQQPDYLGPSFSPIMGYAEHGAIIHYGATPETNVPLKPEGFLLSDTGGHYLQGSTDVTRTFVLGPLTEEMKFHYTLVLRSHLALLSAQFKQNCAGIALDILARKPFWDLGLDYNHGTGHGVGYLLSVHEGPQSIRYQIISGSRIPAAFAPGMITSDEPGIYLAGQYGIRLESLMVCVTRLVNEYGTFYGFEPLTLCPFEKAAILTEQLSAEERSALNAYHALVLEQLSPYFSGADLSWLQDACSPV